MYKFSIFTFVFLCSGMILKCNIKERIEPAEPCHKKSLTRAEQSYLIINRLRIREGQPELLLDSVLIGLAARYARDLALREEVSHMDQKGRGPLERMVANGYIRSLVGENIARLPDHASNTSTLIKEWWQKDREKNNMISGKYYRMGSGFYSSNGICYCVTLFTD